jgi:hypothetical protein
MRMPPTIGDYFSRAIEGVKSEVDSTSDDGVLGMDANEWVGYLVRKWGMEPIQLDETRQPTMEEVEVEGTLRRYDIYSDRGPGSVMRSTNVIVHVPVEPSDTIQAIWKHKLAPNQFHLSVYPSLSPIPVPSRPDSEDVPVAAPAPRSIPLSPKASPNVLTDRKSARRTTRRSRPRGVGHTSWQ